MSEINISMPEGGTVVTLKNVGTKRRVVSISGSNQQFPLEPDQEVKVRAFTTSELVGYLSQEDGSLLTTWEGDTAPESAFPMEPADSKSLETALTEGGSVRLTKPISDVSKIMKITKPTTLNMAGQTLSGSAGTTMIQVAEGSLTITGNGTMKNNNGYALYVGTVKSGDKSGTLVIENGTFTGATTAVHCIRGKVEIKGGTFKVEGGSTGSQYLLNCQDDASGKASIEVSGGKFYGFNPADADTHDKGNAQHINYVKAGYKSVSRGDYYEVVANS